MQMETNEYITDPGGAAADEHLPSNVDIFRRRIWVILPLLMTFGSIGLLVAVYSPDVYEADARLLVEKQSSALDFGTGGKDTRWDPNFHQTQENLIEGRAVMEIALRDHRIRAYISPDGQDPIPEPGLNRVSVMVRALLSMSPHGTAEPWERLASEINARHIEDTDIFSIRARSHSAAQAAGAANAAARAFETFHRERHVRNLGNEYQVLKGEKERAEAELLKAEETLQIFRENSVVVAPSLVSGNASMVTKLKRINARLTEVKLQRIALASQIAVLNDALDTRISLTEKGLDRRLFSIPIIHADAKLGSLRDELADAEKERALLRDTYGDAHPTSRKADAQLDHLREQFSDLLVEVAMQQENTLREFAAQEVGLIEELDQENAHALKLAKEEFEYVRLQNSVDRNTKLLDALNESMREADIGRGLARIRVDIIEEAMIPVLPESSGAIWIVLIFLLFGLLAGWGLAILFEHLDDTIKTPEDLTTRLTVPLLGFIPSMDPIDDDTPVGTVSEGLRETYRGVLISLRDRLPGASNSYKRELDETLDSEPSDRERHRRGTLVSTEPMSSIAEAYRSVRASLMHSMPADEIQMIAVTSCRPREGKTTTCCNLALSLSQIEKRVLLIDADLHRPTIKRTFQLDSDAGLTSALMGEAHWKACISTPCIASAAATTLDILPAGPTSPNPSELLGSKRMSDLLGEVRREYDIVIVDTPPVLFVSDASILGLLSDGIVLVVKSGDSTRALLTRAIDRLASVHAKLIGSVLNGVVLSRVGRYYSTYYHIGYSRYAKDYAGKYYESQTPEKNIARPEPTDRDALGTGRDEPDRDADTLDSKETDLSSPKDQAVSHDSDAAPLHPNDDDAEDD